MLHKLSQTVPTLQRTPANSSPSAAYPSISTLATGQVQKHLATNIQNNIQRNSQPPNFLKKSSKFANLARAGIHQATLPDPTPNAQTTCHEIHPTMLREELGGQLRSETGSFNQKGQRVQPLLQKDPSTHIPCKASHSQSSWLTREQISLETSIICHQQVSTQDTQGQRVIY